MSQQRDVRGSKKKRKEKKDKRDTRILSRLREDHILYTGISGCFFVLNKDADLFIKVVARGNIVHAIVSSCTKKTNKKQIKEKRLKKSRKSRLFAPSTAKR